MTSSTFYMPTRFDSAAPRFDDHDPTTLLPFFDDLELLFTRARISDDQEKKNHARRYAPDRAYDVFAAISQFAAPASYSDFKEAILDLWPGSRNSDRFRRADLEVLLAKRRCTAIASETDLAEFYRNFLAMSEQLIVSQRLCVLEQRRAFATAFDVPLWSAISRRLDILNCDRNPELPPAICDIYEAARHVLRSRKARARAAPPATFVPVPAKLALSPAPVATASPPSIASAPAVPVIASLRPIAAVAPRRPAVALQPPSLLARPAQVPPTSLAPPAPLHVASRPAFAAPKPVLAPIATTTPPVTSHAPSLKPVPALAVPSCLVPQHAPVANHLLAPAPAPRQRSIEESAKILAAFTWQPPRRVASAPEPADDSETFADVFASLSDPFDASTPAPDRVARAQRIYCAYPSLPISFHDFFCGTIHEPIATLPTSRDPPPSPTESSTTSFASPPCLPIGYLPPSSPLFASLPKPRSCPRLRTAAIAPRTVQSPPSRPPLTIPSSLSLPTLHPTSLSFGELLGVAPGVRNLLHAFLDVLESEPRESRPPSHARDVFDHDGVALALRSVPPTYSQSRCVRNAPRCVTALALRVANPRYEPMPACPVADLALRLRQTLSCAPSRSSSAPWCSTFALAPLPPTSSLSPALAPALRHNADDPLALDSAAAPAHPAESHVSSAVSHRRVDSPEPRESASQPAPRKPRVATCDPHKRAPPLSDPPSASRSVPPCDRALLACHVSAAPYLAKTAPCHHVDDPERAQRPPNLRDRDRHLSDLPPAIPSPCNRAPLVCHVSAAPCNASPVHSPLAVAALLATVAIVQLPLVLVTIAIVIAPASPPLATPVHVSLALLQVSAVRPAPGPFANVAAVIAPAIVTIAALALTARRAISRSFARRLLHPPLALRDLHLPRSCSASQHAHPCDFSAVPQHTLRRSTLRNIRRPRNVFDRDIAPAIRQPRRLRLQYPCDFGPALVAASRQGSRVRSRFRKTSLPLAHAPASHPRHRYRLRRVIAHALALRNRV